MNIDHKKVGQHKGETLDSERGGVTILNKEASTVEFTRVLHVPKLATNLLSVLFLTRRCGYTVAIDQDNIFFNYGRHTRFTATITDSNAAFLNGNTQVHLEHASLISTLPLDHSLWHRRLCHHNYANIKMMIEQKLVTG